MRETEDIVQKSLDFLPLKSYANIREGNALRLDWASVVPVEKLSYIMGNPPFVGYSLQTKSQKEDILSVFLDEKGKPTKTAGKLDYVSAWFYKAAQLISGTPTRAALVATNSVCQGEQVAALWKPLFEQFKIRLDFAYRTFRWDSDASDKAHVHCVIIGFSSEGESFPCIFTESGERVPAKNINPYLIDAPDVFVESRNKPICNVPEIIKGSSPVDGGNFFLEENERNEIISAFPKAEKMIRRFLGAREFLHNLPRYCIWLEDTTPAEIKSVPAILKRVAAAKEFRLASTKAATRKFAEMPTRFMEMRQPKTNYILIPRHSSENRKYIPFGFMSPDVICGDANNMLPDATIYHFGILTSSVHMAWVRVVCGRIKSDYRYSNDVVYNNFPWCEPTPEQRVKIEATAQAILDARERYPDCSLADLYDETTMPSDLRRAHRDNDRAVLAAYGFPKEITESQCVSLLMQRYNRGGETILSPRRKAP